MKPSSPVSVLLLAADSGEGGLGSDMIDPVLRARFAEEGVHFQASYVSDLRREQLDLFHIVLLLRSPVPGHPIGDLEDFQRKTAWLRGFVEGGGGLFVMFTECYGKSVSPLNELCEPWGLRFYFNRLAGSPGAAPGRLPRLVESVTLPFRFADNPCVKPPAETLRLVTEGGHGAQHLTCVCEGGNGIRWHPVLRGGPSITSQNYGPFYINGSASDIVDPVVCAAAEIGGGRVLAFPGSAPFWIVNSHIWRFQGYLQEQDHDRGLAFFLAGFRWLAGSARNAHLPADVVHRAEQAVDRRLLVKTQHFSFHTVDEVEQERLQRCTSAKVWFGPGAYEWSALSALSKKLSSAGYSAAFPLGNYHELNEHNWPEILRMGRDSSSDDMLVVPGYELLDDEGVRSAVVSPEQLPRHMLRYPNSTLLEAVWISIFGCISILREPLANRIPPQRYG
ncbi:MAG: hypothetical protein JXB04_03215, partial [Kiritimatiellae bacterium]|nr:hypothetical protein [Kiritimatiellia bacterium]